MMMECPAIILFSGVAILPSILRMDWKQFWPGIDSATGKLWDTENGPATTTKSIWSSRGSTAVDADWRVRAFVTPKEPLIW
jgi:hypothetical protein